MTEGYIEIAEWLSGMVSSVIAIEYIHHGFEKKKTSMAGLLFFAGGCITYFAVVSVLYRKNEFEGIAGLLYGLVMLLYAVLALKGVFREKVMLCVLWVLIALMSSYLLYGVAGVITGKNLSALFAERGNGKLHFAMGALVLRFLFGRFVLFVKMKKRGGIGTAEDWAAVGTLFMVFILMVGMFGLEEGRLEQRTRALLSLALLGGCCSIILLLGYLYHRLEVLSRRRLEAEFFLKIKGNEEASIKNILKHDREIRKIRHDLKGSMDVLHQLLKNGKHQEALKYIEDIDEKIQNAPQLPRDTGNEGLNSALIRMLRECKEKDIPFQYLIGCPLSEMDAMDMGVLFSNLLSNALEACERAGLGGEIELEIREKGSWLHCRLENSIDGSVLEKNPHFKTTKAEKELHGYGMESIGDIVKKYGGTYSCLEEKDIFIQTILLRKTS